MPCSGSTVVSLTFGGQVFEIDPRDLAFIPLDNDPNGDCISGITAGSVGSRTQWLVCPSSCNILTANSSETIRSEIRS